MIPISQSNLAIRAGVARQHISKLMKADPPQFTIVINEKGKAEIDLDGHLTAQYLSGRKPKHKLSPPGKPESPPENPYENEKPIYTPAPHNPTGANGANEETKELKDENLELKNEKLRIENGQKRGNLIEKRLVEILFGKMYQIDEDQFKQKGVDVAKRSIVIFSNNNRARAKEIVTLIDDKEKITVKDVESLLNTNTEPVKLAITSMFEDVAADFLKSVRREIDNFIEKVADEQPV